MSKKSRERESYISKLERISSEKFSFEKHLKWWLTVLFVVSFLLSIVLKVDDSHIGRLVAAEQVSIFFIGAVLFLFNESIIGYSVLSKLSSNLSKLESKKNQILERLELSGDKQASIAFAEFIGVMKECLGDYKKRTETFRSISFTVYSIITVVSFVLILLTTLKGRVFDSNTFCELKYKIGSQEIALGNFFLTWSFFSQVLLLALWGYMAYKLNSIKIEFKRLVEYEEFVSGFKEYYDDKKMDRKDVVKHLKEITGTDNLMD